MSSEKGPIDREDLVRLQRFSTLACALLDAGGDIEIAENASAMAGRYKEAFETRARSITQCEAQYRAQQQSVQELEVKLRQNHNELSATQLQLKEAVGQSDVDTVARLNGRVPALQLTTNNLEWQLEAARRELATRWQEFETARGQVDDIRRLVDNDSSELERIVSILEHANDPALEEIRARHRELLNPTRGEARSPAQPEATKVINLTRRTDELPIQVTRSSEA